MKSHANKLAIAVAACSLSLTSLSQAQQLEEVVVTAAKVEASIQDTPIAVSAFTQDQLDAQLINDASAMQFSVPNLNITKGNFTSQDIRIRGIGSGAVGTFGDTGVGIHVNGIYQVATRIFETQFLDVERVKHCVAHRVLFMVVTPRVALLTSLPLRQTLLNSAQASMVL